MKLQFGLLTLLIACGGESVIEKQDNTAPTVIIGSHSPDAEILEGYVESFRATVSDDDNDYDELTVAWYVGEEIVCDWESVSPAGESFCDIVFTEEDTNVVVEVRDPVGAGGRAEIGVVVIPTSAPTAQILSPTQNSNHYSDQLIQFSGMVDDNEDNPEDLIVTWSSSLDGDLILDTSPDSDGMISDYGYLSEGQHALELKVEDSSGKITKEQLILQVGGANAAPTCGLLSPVAQASFQVGTSIVFEGTAQDDNVAATELMVSFNSDKDGDLGAATIVSSGAVTFTNDQLSNNTHVISMLVVDEVGASCSDSVLIFVGTPPSVVIEEPQSGEVFSVGTDILFHGSFVDAEDPMNDITVSWDASGIGEIASGNPDSQGSHQFSTNTLPAGLHTISLSATDTTSLSGSDTVTIRVNTPPTSPMVSFNPNPVYGNSTLTVAATGSTDADGDPVSYSYQWFEDGVIHSSTTTSIGASDLDVGEIWTVRVTPNDGYTDGVYTESSITISNSEPTVTTPIISSSSGSVYNDSVLTCTSTASDADETVTPTYSWDVNGATVVGSTIDLSNYSVSVGDSIECSAMVMDSNGGSATSQSVEMIENRDPTIASVSISPSSPTSQDLLTCSIVSSDMDGESLTESMEWFVAGSSVSTSMTLDLSSVGASPNDTVECVVVVTDPSGSSDQSSSTVSVVNTNPTIDVLTLTPSEPTLNDTLSCYAESSDLDGDTPTIGFSFTNQTTGSIYSPTTTSTNVATLDISSTDADYEHILTCEVTSTDADNGTSTDSISATIVNTGPVFDQGAVITPSVAEIGTDVECSAVASDPDDGVASLSYVWQVNGVQVSTGPTWTVNSTDASVGDDLTCMAVAVDFEGNSTTSNSAPVTLNNTAPVVSGVVLNNLSPYTNDIVSVSSSTFDFNGDAVTLTYEWHILDASNGGQDTVIQAGPGNIFSSLDGSQSLGFDRDDEIYVNVTPNDGSDNGVTVESDHAIVLNTIPTSPSVAVTSTSNPPMEGVDDLTCTIIGGSTDLDGDPIDYTYTWYDPTGTDVQILSNTSTMFYTFAGTSTTPGLWECDVVASDGTDTANASADIEVDSDWAGALTFTNCGQTGRTGPSQSQCDTEYSGSTLDAFVSVSSGYQTWIVQDSGTYSVEVAGAQGGGVSTYAGGRGAVFIGEFTWTTGTVVEILVGQVGLNSPISSTSGYSAGGGGGTFVVENGTPIVVAGGGGGAGVVNSCSSYTSLIPGLPGQITELGVPGQGVSCTNHATSIGEGGGGDTCGTGASSGAGYYGDSQDYSAGSWATKADAYVNGGEGARQRTNGADGGFGGGGAGAYGGGGGGGYSGGGTGHYTNPCRDQGGGGGGSYNAGTNQSNQSGVNTGHGYVIIDKL